MRCNLAASAMSRNSTSFLHRLADAQVSQSHRTCKQESFRRYPIGLFLRCRRDFYILLFILRLHVQSIAIQIVCCCLRLGVILMSFQVFVSRLFLVIVIIVIRLTPTKCSLKCFCHFIEICIVVTWSLILIDWYVSPRGWLFLFQVILFFVISFLLWSHYDIQSQTTILLQMFFLFIICWLM